jgi:hypothetical protein
MMKAAARAALITCYGFLSISPLILLRVAVLSRALADHPDLRRRLIVEIASPALRPTIENSLATLPTSTIPFVAALIGLLFAGTGVVFSAYQTLNHAVAARHRLRTSFISQYVRVFAVLAALMAGAGHRRAHRGGHRAARPARRATRRLSARVGAGRLHRLAARRKGTAGAARAGAGAAAGRRRRGSGDDSAHGGSAVAGQAGDLRDTDSRPSITSCSVHRDSRMPINE